MNGIATSVVVHPSRRLRFLLLLMAVLLGVVSLQLLRMPAAESRLVLHQLLSMVCVAAALRLFYRGLTLTKSCVIDVSGTGAIHLHHTGRVAAEKRSSVSDDQHSSEVVQLLKDSTLWSSMLLLRLRSTNGHVFVIPVLPDSTSTDSFRHLSIACRWIVRQEAVLHP